MTWTRLSDDFTDRPEALEVSRSARLLNIEAMVWCNRMLRDGLLPKAALPRITDSADTAADVTELVKAGMWVEVDDVGWQLDWTDQESADDVRARQAQQAEKQKRYRDRKARHAQGDHSACHPTYCKAAVTGHATSDVTGLVTPSRPDPSRPLGRDREQGAGPGSAGATPASAAGEDKRWSAWLQTPLAHAFANHDRGGACTYTGNDSETDLCGQPYRSPEHEHRWQPDGDPRDSQTPCRVCDQPRAHGVHSDRRKSSLS